MKNENQPESVKAAADLSEKAADFADRAKDSVVRTMDVSGDGRFDIEDVIVMALKIPGIRIDRSDFLRAQLDGRYPQSVIENAVAFNPSHAGIPQEDIDKIADDVIRFERGCVSGISAALGMPGGVAKAATIPADLAQYYGYMLRAAQKLMYLYGFPEVCIDDEPDSDAMDYLTLCLGVMYDVQGSKKAILKITKALAIGVEKTLVGKPLAQGMVHPAAKFISDWFAKHLTQQVLAGLFKTAVPVAGGVIGGAITFASFKPCCDQLKDTLRNTALSNPNAVKE